MTRGRKTVSIPAGSAMAMEVPTEIVDVADAIDVLRDGHRSIERLSGGLTNDNFKVTTGRGAFVLRVSPPGTELLAIDRFNEQHNSVLAHRAGVGAAVHAFHPELSALVLEFIEGSTLTDASFAIPGNVERVAHAVRQLHGAEAFLKDFDMFEIQRGYLEIVQQRGFRLPARYLEFMPVAARIRAAIAPEPTVPCNNDLLAANFIDDGARVRIIDYEYSGNNDACFELGNIWSECHLDDDQLRELLNAYYGEHLRNREARARLLGLMGQYGWTLWGSIQASTSRLDFDFWDWAMEKYERAQSTFTSPALDRMLDEAQRKD